MILSACELTFSYKVLRIALYPKPQMLNYNLFFFLPYITINIKH